MILLRTLLPTIYICLTLASCTTPPQISTVKGRTMGTSYSVKIVTPPQVAVAIKADIDTLLKKINQQMSTYIADSEISRFNQSNDGDWHTFSPEAMTVLQEAQEVSARSGGAFDVTIAPLVNLWGFGPEQQTTKPPNALLIAQARANTGFQLLTLDPQHNRARKKKPTLQIDLSAIAKGYAVDAVSKLLSKKGFDNHLVEIGGEIRATGNKPDQTPWNIALEKAISGSKQIEMIIKLKDMALATSGSYRNYFDNNGTRYSHTIDPTSGRPITHRLVAVSVMAADCMSADAWATAIMVLGPEKGLIAAEKNKIPALLTSKTKNGFKERGSTLWNSLLP